MSKKTSTKTLGAGLGIVAGWTGVAIGMPAIYRLFSLTQDSLAIGLERDTHQVDGAAVVDLGGRPMDLTGAFTIAAPLEDLSGWALALLLVANIVHAVGAIVAAFAFATGLNQATSPKLDTARGARSLRFSFWALAGTIMISGFAYMNGTAAAIGDLGLSGVGNGVTLPIIFGAVGALGLVWFLQTMVRRAAAAEADTEGLV